MSSISSELKQQEKETNQKTIQYYEACEIDYRLVWHLGASAAMHFGYWDDTTKNLRQALQRENAILAERAGIRPTDRVLDAGCGVGGSAIYLAKTIGCNVVGITIVPSQAQSARQNARKHGLEERLTFEIRDFCNTELPDASFDVVWAIESVCHAHRKEAFLQEAYRLLTKTGRIIVADGFATKEHYTADEHILMQKWLNGWGVEALESQAGFGRHLSRIGFKNISYTNINKYVMPSSKRLYRYSYPGIIIGKVFELLRIRSRIQTADIIATYYQHIALKKGLWEYGIYYAERHP